MNVSTMYDRAGTRARDWAETIRDEVADISPADVISDAGEWAAELVGDTAEKIAARLPGAVAARRSRRKRWILLALAASVALYLFGPGGTDRRAGIRRRLNGGASGTAGGPDLTRPSETGHTPMR